MSCEWQPLIRIKLLFPSLFLAYFSVTNKHRAFTVKREPLPKMFKWEDIFHINHDIGSVFCNG